MARQTRSGVVGMSMSVTPSGDNASITALTTAGGEPMVPASPTPFHPPGLLVDGVMTWSVTKEGSSAADGTR